MSPAPFLFLLLFYSAASMAQIRSPHVINMQQLDVRGNRVFLQDKKMSNAALGGMLNQYEESALYWKKFRRQTFKLRVLETTGILATALLLSDTESMIFPQERDWWRFVSIGLLDAALALIDIRLRQKRHQYLLWSVDRYNRRSIQQFLY